MKSATTHLSVETLMAPAVSSLSHLRVMYITRVYKTPTMGHGVPLLTIMTLIDSGESVKVMARFNFSYWRITSSEKRIFAANGKKLNMFNFFSILNRILENIHVFKFP